MMMLGFALFMGFGVPAFAAETPTAPEPTSGVTVAPIPVATPAPSEPLTTEVPRENLHEFNGGNETRLYTGTEAFAPGMDFDLGYAYAGLDAQFWTELSGSLYTNPGSQPAFNYTLMIGPRFNFPNDDHARTRAWYLGFALRASLLNYTGNVDTQFGAQLEVGKRIPIRDGIAWSPGVIVRMNSATYDAVFILQLLRFSIFL